ncbi:hypothetical protein ABE10_01720, partial [Bacillus toyonensis]|nr:hypothetical protein [Bacillus toyonensis]
LQGCLGLLLGLVRLGDVALDGGRTLVEHLRQARKGDLPHHDEDDQEPQPRPDDVVPRGDERVLRLALCREVRDKSVQHPVSFRGRYGLREGDESDGDADERKRLGEGDTDPHEDLQSAGQLGLTGDALDGLADHDAHTDGGADGGEAVADRGDVAVDVSENRSSVHGFVSFRLWAAASRPRPRCALVLFCDRELDVDRGEDREDVGLQDSDQDLEDREGAAEGEGGDAESGPAASGREEEELGRREAEHQQHVPDHHVHQQSEHQRDRTQDEGRDELDDCDDRQREPGDALRHQGVLEETEPMAADAGVDEGDVADDGQQERNGRDARARDVQERDDARDVHEQDHEEDGREDRQEPVAVLAAEQVVRDAVADEAEAHLDEALEATGDHTHAARTEPEDEHDRDDREELHQVDAVDRDAEDVEQDLREELVHRRTVELAPVGGHTGGQGRSKIKQRGLQLRGTGQTGATTVGVLLGATLAVRERARDSAYQTREFPESASPSPSLRADAAPGARS